MANDTDQAPALSILLTADQMLLLGTELQRVLEHGFGDVMITVNRGHVRFVRATLSHELPNGDLHEDQETDNIKPS